MGGRLELVHSFRRRGREAELLAHLASACRPASGRGSPPTAPQPAQRAGVDEASLFAEMLTSPDDDAVRLVLADIYSERSDVRAELITLQIKNARAEKPAPKDVKKEKDLLKQHLMGLLGPLEQVVDRKTCVFFADFSGTLK